MTDKTLARNQPLPDASRFTSWRKGDKRKRRFLFVASILWVCLHVLSGALITIGHVWAIAVPVIGWGSLLFVYRDIEGEFHRMDRCWGQTSFWLDIANKNLADCKAHVKFLESRQEATAHPRLGGNPDATTLDSKTEIES